jgi:hypothetical protein
MKGKTSLLDISGRVAVKLTSGLTAIGTRAPKTDISNLTMTNSMRIIHNRTIRETSGFYSDKEAPLQEPANGGAYRDRTDDLMLAKHALSQLS